MLKNKKEIIKDKASLLKLKAKDKIEKVKSLSKKEQKDGET